MFAAALTERIAAFLRGIGIEVRGSELAAGTFLPGIAIAHGAILIDEARLEHPGDLLHEAGHIAVAGVAERVAPSLAPDLGDEIAAQAWSYAALRRLALAPDVVFHAQGYRGSSQALIAAYSAGRDPVPGVPLLACYGMTVERKHAAGRGVDPFPHMLRWMR
jgi:hypothetical protein